MAGTITDLVYQDGTWVEVTGGTGTPAGSVITWDDVQNKPLEFNPAAHTHTVADIIDLGSVGGTTAVTTDSLPAGVVLNVVNWDGVATPNRGTVRTDGVVVWVATTLPPIVTSGTAGARNGDWLWRTFV